ncbi:MAG: hypothetical protein ISEC1_P1896 [Thiomicrorhabdus sp.]|nr:MAG: hypothetical protein ISEC1_P1896 [Thiomicrorhabdus sp.]
MQTYLITGAAQGLGKALATNLVNRGHQVILLDKAKKALNHFYDELNSELVALYPMDLLGANIDHYKELQEILSKEYGQLNGVFLCAKVLPAFSAIDNFDYKQWYEVMHTNLDANFHMTQTMLPLLIEAKNGKLVAILDQDVEAHPAYYGAYGVAKAGLEQLMVTVGVETTNADVDIYTAKLESFSSEARNRLFPGQDPTNLPTAADMAERILGAILDAKAHKTIQKR